MNQLKDMGKALLGAVVFGLPLFTFDLPHGVFYIFTSVVFLIFSLIIQLDKIEKKLGEKKD